VGVTVGNTVGMTVGFTVGIIEGLVVGDFVTAVDNMILIRPAYVWQIRGML